MTKAQAVDREQGHFSDGPADVLEGFAEEAEIETFGPVGRARE